MTVLEDDDVISKRNKLSLTKLDHGKKRKHSLQESTPSKKILLGEMLNGFRSNDNRNAGDVSQQCPVATLSNMGNTCFLNSVLYTLRFAPTFLHNLHHLIDDLVVVNNRLNQNKTKSSSLGRNISSISGPSSRSTSSKDLLSLGSINDIIPKTKVQIVTEKLHQLFVTMHQIENGELKDAYQPVEFLQAVREANYIFEGNHQQDAHELLVYLLDNIRETCELLAQQVQHYPELLIETETTVSNSKFWQVRRSWKKGNKKKEKSVKDSITEEHTNGSCINDSEDGSADSSSDNGRKKLGYNFVCEDFEGITLRRTRCLECESVTERKEPFYDIPVPINFRDDDFGINPSEIYRRACVTSEKLCDTNKYLCDNCKRYNEASREVSFEKLPNIMVLQLKRFTSSLSGVQKVNSYLPTPLELECFCETCCQIENGFPSHRYKLCCVIMHLGGTMASGHYIAYVRASDPSNFYADCSHDMPKTSLSASSSEKSINILKQLKYLKPRAFSSTVNGLPKSSTSGFRLCRSIECCGVKLNRSIIENVLNNHSQKNNQFEDVWLECDDETIRPISSQEFEDLLGCKSNSTSTPYLLFYSKITTTGFD